MENTMTWRTDQSPDLARALVAPFEITLDDERLNSLRDLALMLLREVESLRVEAPSHVHCGAGLQNQVQRFESDLIRQALERTAGNQARAARLLGVKHTTLNAKIHRYQIAVNDQSKELESEVSETCVAA